VLVGAAARVHGGRVEQRADHHARVVLRYQPEELAIEIVDDGAGARAGASGSGHRLVGMRERAALHGGSLEAGPLPVRGYRVAALSTTR